MGKVPTQAAQVATIIRAELKQHGIPARVKSRNYSMGCAVDVYLADPSPGIYKRVRDFADKYQSGDFDGMTDSYTYRSGRNGPTAKYVFVQAEYSDTLRQAAWEYLRGWYAGGEDMPADFNAGANLRWQGEWGSTQLHRCLNGTLGRFWRDRLSRVRLVADVGQAVECAP